MNGVWGGYIIDAEDNGITYKIKTVDGVRGFGVPVFVSNENGKWSAKDKNGREIALKEVAEHKVLWLI
jgi:hypothetical protein